MMTCAPFMNDDGRSLIAFGSLLVSSIRNKPPALAAGNNLERCFAIDDDVAPHGSKKIGI